MYKKRLWSYKNPENGLFPKSHPIKEETYVFVLFLFLLQDNSHSSFVAKFRLSKLKMQERSENYQFGRKSAYF